MNDNSRSKAVTDRLGLLSRLVSSDVTVVERFGATAWADLDQRYASNVQRAVRKRQRDHMAGRSCAHAALARIGRDVPHLGILPSGAPDWPKGVRGSITHCSEYVACAVSEKSQTDWLGIDAEPAEPISAEVAQVVAHGHEHEWISRAPLNGRILFCAKEAVFKAWYPVRQTSLDFADASLEFNAEEQTFIALIHMDGNLHLRGRWDVSDGIIATIVAQAGPS